MNATTRGFLERLNLELRTRRAAADVKNADLASHLGVSPSTLSGWFRGSGSPPRIDRLFELTQALNVPLSEVIHEAESETEDRDAVK